MTYDYDIPVAVLTEATFVIKRLKIMKDMLWCSDRLTFSVNCTLLYIVCRKAEFKL